MCAETEAASIGTGHVTAKQRCKYKYTTSMEISNELHMAKVTHSESHATRKQ